MSNSLKIDVDDVNNVEFHSGNMYRHCQIGRLYLYLNQSTRQVSFHSASPDCNSTPVNVYHGLDIDVNLPANVDAESVSQFLRSNAGQTLLFQLWDGWSSKHDGRNWVGVQTKSSLQAQTNLESVIGEMTLGEDQGPIYINDFENMGLYDDVNRYIESPYAETMTELVQGWYDAPGLHCWNDDELAEAIRNHAKDKIDQMDQEQVFKWLSTIEGMNIDPEFAKAINSYR